MYKHRIIILHIYNKDNLICQFYLNKEQYDCSECLGMGSLVEYAVTDRVPALAQQGPGRCLFCGSRARIEFQLLHYLDTYDVQVAWLPYDRSGKHWITSGEQRIGVVIRISGEQGEEHVLFNFQRRFGCLRLCSLPPVQWASSPSGLFEPTCARSCRLLRWDLKATKKASPASFGLCGARGCV